MGQAGILPLSRTGTVVLRIQNLGQKGGARQGEQRTQQPSHPVPCPSENLQHGHTHRPDNTSKGPPQPGGRAPVAIKGWGGGRCAAFTLKRNVLQVQSGRRGKGGQGRGKRQSFPCRRGERQGEGRGCGRPVAGRRGALAWACSSVHPGGAGAGATGEPAEGAVRPLRRPRGDTSPSCRRLGPPAGEGLPGSPTASSSLAYSPAAESARARRSPAARPPALSRPPPSAAVRAQPRPQHPQPAPGPGHAVLPVPRRVPGRDLREYLARPAPRLRARAACSSAPAAPRPSTPHRFPAFVCRAGWGRGAPPSAGPGGWPRPTCPSEPVVSVARPLGQTGRHGRLVLLGTQNVPLCL